jgi:tetratricopeptide (TPR) repeat protein
MDVVDGLVSLADQSLIRSVETSGDPRFQILDTIEAFAAERLAERGEMDEIAGRHARWFCALAERIAPELSGDMQRERLDQLDREHDNIRAVLDRSVAAGNADVSIRLSFAVWRYWQKRGHLYEARRRLDAMAAAPWSRSEPRLRARLLEALGGVCWWQADIVAMRTAYEEAAGIWREIGDKAELANALYNYSFAFTVPTQPGGAIVEVDPSGEGRRALEEALGLYRELGDVRGQANVQWGLGNRMYFSNLGDAGVDHFGQALAGFRQVGDVTMEAWALHMLGGALLRARKTEESRPHLREALRHFNRAGDAAGIAMVIDDLSSQALAEDDAARAAKLWGAARKLTAATGANLVAFIDGWIEQQVRPNVKATLAPADLERWAAEGAAMSLDEAVAFALDAPGGEAREEA